MSDYIQSPTSPSTPKDRNTAFLLALMATHLRSKQKWLFLLRIFLVCIVCVVTTFLLTVYSYSEYRAAPIQSTLTPKRVLSGFEWSNINVENNPLIGIEVGEDLYLKDLQRLSRLNGQGGAMGFSVEEQVQYRGMVKLSGEGQEPAENVYVIAAPLDSEGQ